jgi:hypothetical protein
MPISSNKPSWLDVRIVEPSCLVENFARNAGNPWLPRSFAQSAEKKFQQGLNSAPNVALDNPEKTGRKHGKEKLA